MLTQQSAGKQNQITGADQPPLIKKEEKTMWKPKTINAYVDGKKVCDVVKEALACNVMAEEMKRRIKEQYPDVEFKVERRT